MESSTATTSLLYSKLASDPDLAEIVDMFVEEMPGRVAALQEQLNSADWDALSRTAHQLKGAAGSYGFDPLSPCAGKVETAVRNGEPEQAIRETVNELVDMCNRVRGGVPQT
jgi:HPt (histidine-containing phosphotransfer) domain-containing protein